MLLSYNELCILVDNNVITNVKPEYINSASIDITLGDKILREAPAKSVSRPYHAISLAAREPLVTYSQDTSKGILLKPGEFILAQSEQVFNLPTHISAEYKLKSSMARIGINHCLAGWCDAGWNGSVLTLELMNVSQHHAIRLQKGDRIGQMIFFQHEEVQKDKSYAARGRYNGDTEVTGAKVHNPAAGTTYDIYEE